MCQSLELGISSRQVNTVQEPNKGVGNYRGKDEEDPLF